MNGSSTARETGSRSPSDDAKDGRVTARLRIGRPPRGRESLHPMAKHLLEWEERPEERVARKSENGKKEKELKIPLHFILSKRERKPKDSKKVRSFGRSTVER